MWTINHNVPLRQLNTFGVEGVARCVIDWDDASDLMSLWSQGAIGPSKRVKTIGEGSNLLFVNPICDTVLTRCTATGVRILEDDGSRVLVEVDAGARLDDVAALTAAQGLWGLENLSHIPGTAGAAAVQNVGAYGVEFKDVVVEIRCFDLSTGSEVVIDVADAAYGYRDSRFKHTPSKETLVVTRVVLALSRQRLPVLGYGNLASALKEIATEELTPMHVREAIIATRRGKLPEVGETGSAGSYFKNPVVTVSELDHVKSMVAEMDLDPEAMPVYEVDGGFKLSAAWLIDRAGWKGFVRGNVGTWPLQPLVLINVTGQATGHEIAALASDIIASVQNKFSVTLSPEVEYI